MRFHHRRFFCLCVWTSYFQVIESWNRGFDQKHSSGIDERNVSTDFKTVKRNINSNGPRARKENNTQAKSKTTNKSNATNCRRGLFADEIDSNSSKRGETTTGRPSNGLEPGHRRRRIFENDKATWLRVRYAVWKWKTSSKPSGCSTNSKLWPTNTNHLQS